MLKIAADVMTDVSVQKSERSTLRIASELLASLQTEAGRTEIVHSREPGTKFLHHFFSSSTRTSLSNFKAQGNKSTEMAATESTLAGGAMQYQRQTLVSCPQIPGIKIKVLTFFLPP